MKHLIRLSLKYIRRQKLRTFLTFTCIVLATFLMASFGAYLGSAQQSTIRFLCEEEGSGEVDVSRILKDCPKKNALEILQNHAVVEEYFVEGNQYSSAGTSRDETGNFGYFTLQINDGDKVRLDGITQSFRSGNPYLRYGREAANVKTTDNLPENGIIVPSWVEDMGYHTGDTVTFTLEVCHAKLDAESPQIQEAVDYLLQQSEKEKCQYYIVDGEELPLVPEQEYSRVSAENLPVVLSKWYTLDEMDLTEETVEQSVSYTGVIAGFQPEYASALNRKYAAFETPASIGYLCDFSQTVNGYTESNALITVTDRIELEDALMLLLKDMGFEEKDYYEYFTEDAFNQGLLGIRLKGANAISFAFYPIIVILILLLIVWLVSRFIIDNAFEISVQERSTQFAALRIMGASRMQLFALVLTEAIFYCLTAVPIGAGLAVLCCKLVMDGFAKSGLDMFVFYIQPLVLIACIAFAVVGVLISAYTSAMWAARKLSPLEALQFGKPKRRKSKPRKTKKFRNSASFLYYYTMQNILRTGRRFVVSTISMTLAVLLFTSTVLTILSVQKYWVDYRENYGSSETQSADYVLTGSISSVSDMNLAEELFQNSDAVIAKYQLDMFDFMSDEEAREANNAAIGTLVPYWNENMAYSGIAFFITEEEYEANYAPVTGMTYAQFVSSGGALFNAVSYQQVNEYGKPDGYTYETSHWEPAQGHAALEFCSETIPVLGTVWMNVPQTEDKFDAMILPVERAGEFEHNLANYYIYLTVRGVKNREAAKALTEDFIQRSEHRFYLYDQYYMTTGLTTFVASVFRVSMIFMFCIWLVGVISMMNAVNTSVLNRQKELLMMRAVGMTVKQLYQNVFLESILFTAGATVMGSILGVTAYFYALRVLLDGAKIQPLMSAVVIVLVLCLNLGISLAAAVPGVQSIGKRVKT